MNSKLTGEGGAGAVQKYTLPFSAINSDFWTLSLDTCSDRPSPTSAEPNFQLGTSSMNSKLTGCGGGGCGKKTTIAIYINSDF